jgi:hypothetical protein
MEGIPHGGCWWEGCKVCFPKDQKEPTAVTPLEKAKAVLYSFWLAHQRDMKVEREL